MQTENLLQDIVNHTYHWEFYIDANSNPIWVSPGCEDVSGYTPLDFLSNPDLMTQIIHEEDRDLYLSHLISHQEKSEGEVCLNFRIINKQGETVYIKHCCKPILDSTGAHIGRRGCNIDTSALKHTQDKLKENEEIASNILESADDGMAVVNGDGEIIRINNSWRRRLIDTGHDDASCGVGENYFTCCLYDFATPSAAQEAFEGIRTVLNGQSPFFEVNYTSLLSGVPRRYLLRAQNILSSKRMVLISTTDITDSFNAQQELKKALQQADTNSKVKSEFLANINHELRTPLNGILGMLQALQMTAIDAEQKTFINLALKSSSRLMTILTEIVDTIKIGTGLMPPSEHHFTPNGIALDVESLFCSNCACKIIELKTITGESRNHTLIGDTLKIQQIINNLVGNAFKFTSEGTITFECYAVEPEGCGEAEFVFSVSDTGIGIADDKLQIIFEPFTQGDGHMNKQADGIGLGLYVVKKLLDQLNGKMTVDSEVGKGTKIQVSIPVKTPACDTTSASSSPRTASGESSPAHALSILLVEDDDINRQTASLLLEKSGYVVSTAKNGEEALTMLAAKDFDLILMDIAMPVMDGLTAAKAIRNETRFASKSSIPIIALTAHASPGDRERFLAAGMEEYVSKPVEIASLMEIIRRVSKSTSR